MKLGDISPLAGMLTGEGLTGKLMAKGFGGILPAAIARNAQKDKEEEEAAVRTGAARSMKGAGMKKGGVTRADGCIIKGHTKGRII